MHRLISGIREFRENVFPSRRARFEELASGQQPSTLFITCSDSRVVPEMITQTEPGELFVLRNAGNLVPPETAARSGEAATIEYAVQVLKVEDVIVCGHSHCGAIAGLLRPQLVEGLPAVEKWLEHAEQACGEIADQHLTTNDNDDLLTSAIKANVVVQLNHLRTYAAVSQAEQRGELRLHGCFYRFETGEVTVFDDPQRKFVPIADYVTSEIAAGRGEHAPFWNQRQQAKVTRDYWSVTVFASKGSESGFFSTLKFDVPSSIAAFLVALPLCMGIAIASGVPVAAGLITGIVGGIVVGALAGAPLQVSGPAAGLTVVVYEIVSAHGVAALGFVVLAAGLLQIVAGALKLGQWFRAVSPAVIHGMLAGIGVLIFASQFHVMVDDKPKENGIRNLMTIPQAIAKGLPLPESSTTQQREFRTALLKEVGTLHTQQIALRDSIASAQAADPDGDSKPVVPTADLVAQQAAITAGVEQVADRIAKNSAELSDPTKTDAVARSAVEQSTSALSKMQGPTAQADLEAQKTALSSLESLLGNLKNHQWAAKVGILTICALLVWQWFIPKRLKVIPAPLIAVAVAAVAAFLWSLPVLYVEAPDNLWTSIHLPTFAVLQHGNLAALIEAALVMALIASAETLLCATAVDKMHGGQRTNYDRELMAQGVGNTICGLVGALPMTGVIVRSAANVQAGAKTRKSAMLHGVWLLVFVCFLTPVLRTIPVAGLAAVLVYTGYKLVNLKHIVELRKYGWSEVGIYLATLFTIVATDLLTGVVVGIGLSAAKLLYTFAHLQTELKAEPQGKRINLALSGTATFLRLPRLAAALERVPANAELHVDLEQLHYIDHACFDLLMNWAKQHEATGGTLAIDWNSLQAQFREDQPRVFRKSVA